MANAAHCHLSRTALNLLVPAQQVPRVKEAVYCFNNAAHQATEPRYADSGGQLGVGTSSPAGPAVDASQFLWHVTTFRGRIAMNGFLQSRFSSNGNASTNYGH